MFQSDKTKAEITYPPGGFGARRHIKDSLYWRRAAQERIRDGKKMLKKRKLTKQQRLSAQSDVYYGRQDLKKYTDETRRQIAYVREVSLENKFKENGRWFIGARLFDF